MEEMAVALLPPEADLETKAILKKLASAHRYLAELKGLVASIPNENILINTLSLQEAKDSSAIENIITTHDELYKAALFSEFVGSPAAKEVSRYSTALRQGFARVQNEKLLTINHIVDLHQTVEQNASGIRVLPGTALKNDQTDEIIYMPPQKHAKILRLMKNLEQFINDNAFCPVDPLIKMAVIHLQFESIHPFYDGNSRTGRIINILYLVAQGLLDIPVLYLSRYIIRNKSAYYHLLQETRNSGDWEAWILYMLDGVETTAKQAIHIVEDIHAQMMAYKHRLREMLPKIYSQDLLNLLFCHPYTKIDAVKTELQVSRLTATRYLNLLVEHDFLQKHKIGRHNYYVNAALFKLFMNIPD
ncbi:MAG: Fic family protein [Mariprofundaceae bacterium]